MRLKEKVIEQSNENSGREDKRIRIEDLYPFLTEEQRKKVEQTFERYLALVEEIYETGNVDRKDTINPNT